MSKLNLTVQRKAVLDVLMASEDHPTAADIIDRLRLQGQHFAYGTVYNSLRYLTEAGLIRELELGKAASRYDARMDEHQHIICTECGQVDEVLIDVPQQWMEAVGDQTRYHIHEAHVVLKGVCAACAKAKT
ncbi:Fur family transcriptional regulator [Paenibacillus protaetiae]|uniref:Transcriptional repressor n=1 Tax=Paenibacillus protaetiae TaxID=2509456 RepID=A0A4P6EZD9_9BACL|nr:transcriptional repressor [Paenibacillus protaetiae]QAY67663.1 transcriptional repressor [Paenibacillus protaetiae]